MSCWQVTDTYRYYTRTYGQSYFLQPYEYEYMYRYNRSIPVGRYRRCKREPRPVHSTEC